ncbi:hypothetical protein TcasGA2_TC002658 [Tribolium castaneum]|uniref:BED-type domain-containing protein n=1 Tax=Tribolium castaneum TaxID=7070 RepID=D6WEQ5_TRICA|nr:PREDICTED: uncharacterized protein LOC103312429 [Tribolium castaneum]EEZ99876.1 hypothetical protein TcasGA2_TC002658 [Tribolium castaneum]|eukprot:XP_008191256.1 PREDICTED: uncharacterized protein LOC103312429 [Tribolium castaneum]
MPGRNFHSFWTIGKFDILKLNGKVAARCLVCDKILKNTSKQRLMSHRNVCKEENTSKEVAEVGEEDEIILVEIESKADDNDEEESNEVSVEDSPSCSNEQFNDRVSAASTLTLPTSDLNYDENICNTESSNLTSISIAASPSPRMLSPIPSTSKESIHKIINKSISKKSNSKPKDTIKNFLDHVSNNQKIEINKALGKFIVGCNIPFHVVDSIHFKDFLRVLRPAYQPPCRKTVSGTILNSLYDEINEDDQNSIGKFSVMMIDGWKNSANNTKQVVTILKSTRSDKCIFLEAYDVTTTPETGEKLSELCNLSVELAKTKFKTEIYAVVSDNAANMLKMGKLTSDLMHTTCNSHTGNLLAKDLISKELCSKVITILKEFKHPNLEKELQSQGGSKIKLAVDTRWCTYRDSFSCLIKNLKFMKKLAAEETIKLKQEIIQLLFDDEFIDEVKTTIEVSNPVCKLINECQSSSCTIADACEKWTHLQLPAEFEDVLKRRRDMALNIYSLTSNFLHPLYRGRSLNQTQVDMVHDYLVATLSAEGLMSFHQFCSSEDIFETLERKNICCPKVFWGLAERKHPELASVALKLINIPASSASLERVFSNWAFIHNDLRNRLDADHSRKIMHCYYSLKMRESNEVS